MANGPLIRVTGARVVGGFPIQPADDNFSAGFELSVTNAGDAKAKDVDIDAHWFAGHWKAKANDIDEDLAQNEIDWCSEPIPEIAPGKSATFRQTVRMSRDQFKKLTIDAPVSLMGRVYSRAIGDSPREIIVWFCFHAIEAATKTEFAYPGDGVVTPGSAIALKEAPTGKKAASHAEHRKRYLVQR